MIRCQACDWTGLPGDRVKTWDDHGFSQWVCPYCQKCDTLENVRSGQDPFESYPESGENIQDIIDSIKRAKVELRYFVCSQASRVLIPTSVWDALTSLAVDAKRLEKYLDEL